MSASAVSDRPQRSVDEIWEGFARSRPEYYILTQEVSYSGTVDRDAFFASGRRDVAAILEEVGSDLRGTLCAVDIGCGVGRLAIPMAAHFSRVVAVDVSRTMLEHLVANCRSQRLENVLPAHADDPWEELGPADLVFSRIVFQHIESDDAIKAYARRIYLALASDGVAHLQFDTRPQTLIYRVHYRVPGAFLPRTSRRGLRRIRRSAGWLSSVFEAAGMSVVRELRPGTEDHVFVLRRARFATAEE